LGFISGTKSGRSQNKNKYESNPTFLNEPNVESKESRSSLEFSTLNEYINVTGGFNILGDNIRIPKIHSLLLPAWVEKKENMGYSGVDLGGVNKEKDEKEVKVIINVEEVYNMLTNQRLFRDLHHSFLLTENVLFLHRVFTPLSHLSSVSNKIWGRSDVMGTSYKPTTTPSSLVSFSHFHISHTIKIIPVRYSMFFFFLLLPLYRRYCPSFIPAVGLIIALNLVFELILKRFVVRGLCLCLVIS
jgi:hypothetical protein